MSARTRAGLRLPRFRATTAQLCSFYPFQVSSGLGGRGAFLGSDLTAGGDAFCYDPFELYGTVLTNPNMLILGEPGSGKSTCVKTFLYRTVGLLPADPRHRRWVAICDPKGEYSDLAAVLGLDVVKLYPGGVHRLNPLDPGPGGSEFGAPEVTSRRATMVAALLEGILGRDLSPIEDATIGWLCAELSRRPETADPTTLADAAALLASPTGWMADQANTTPAALAQHVEACRFSLGKLLDRDLRGMFDGPSTIRPDWDGRGIVLDLSALHGDAGLGLVMIAATAWLQTLMAAPAGPTTPQRMQVIDEAWALLGNERTARYLQACWKLCRSYGVANIAVAHRISDLRSQADDGTATAKVAMGLLADTQTRVLFSQSTDQMEETKAMLGLTEREAWLLPQLEQGTALWKVAGRTAIVAHVVAPGEIAFCDTDQRFRGDDHVGA